MKVQVDRATFNDAVAWAVRSVPARPSLPVMAGLHLQAVDDQLVISAVDYESSTRVTINAQVDEPGTIVVNGRLLADIARSLVGLHIELNAHDSRATLTSARSRFVLLTLPEQDYLQAPQMPPISGQLSGSVLAQAINQVSVAASKDDSLMVLTGIRCEIDKDKLTMVATDRYRLALKEIRWQPVEQHASAAVLIPAKTAVDAARAFVSSTTVDVALSSMPKEGQTFSDRQNSPSATPLDQEGHDQSMIGFSNDQRRMTSRLLAGQFPASYRSLFPSPTTSQVVVRTDALLEATRRVALVAQGSSPLRLSVDQQGLILEAGRGEDAQAAEAVAALLEGPPLTMAFNHAYLVDGLSVLDTPFVQLLFVDPTKPAILEGRWGADHPSQKSSQSDSGGPREAHHQGKGDTVGASSGADLTPEEVGPVDDSFRYLLMPIWVGERGDS